MKTMAITMLTGLSFGISAMPRNNESFTKLLNVPKEGYYVH